jgi:hypothetical protein
MEQPLTLALLGESLLIDTIEASLRTQADFNVVRVLCDSDVVECCGWRVPDMVIADMQPGGRDTLVSYIAALPGVPVLAIETTSNRAVALHCEHYTIRSSDDLAQVIRCQAASPSKAYTLDDMGDPLGLAELSSRLSHTMHSVDARRQDPPKNER